MLVAVVVGFSKGNGGDDGHRRVLVVAHEDAALVCRQDLDRLRTSKKGRVENYPRLDLHVWNLVARMLQTMGYK